MLLANSSYGQASGYYTTQEERHFIHAAENNQTECSYKWRTLQLSYAPLRIHQSLRSCLII